MKKPPQEIPRSSSICARRAFNGSQPATKSRAEALGWRIYANSPEKRRDVSLGFSKGWLRVRAARFLERTEFGSRRALNLIVDSEQPANRNGNMLFPQTACPDWRVFTLVVRAGA